MENEFELIAKTFMGLEPVLAKELTQLGANNVQIGRRMVSFTGDKEMMYRANFSLHTAIKILKPILDPVMERWLLDHDMEYYVKALTGVR